jgi:hypothetical protein
MASYQEAMQKAREERERSGYDHESFAREPDRKFLSEADGETRNIKLPTKTKEARSSDRMPVIEDAYNMGSRVRQT